MQNASAANNFRAHAIAWDSLREHGQTASGEFILGLDHKWATWFAGAAFAKDSREPFGNEPLTITCSGSENLDTEETNLRRYTVFKRRKHEHDHPSQLYAGI